MIELKLESKWLRSKGVTENADYRHIKMSSSMTGNLLMPQSELARDFVNS